MGNSSTDVRLTDDELAERIAARAESPDHWEAAKRDFEELYHRHADRLLAFVASYVGRSDVEDVHQTVWQRVWQNLPAHYQGGNFRAWLFRIARYHLIDLSRRKRMGLLHDDLLVCCPGAAVPENELIERERREILSRCLGRLETDLAELVSGRLSGESYDEICRRHGWEPSRAHRLFHEAKKQLTSCVERALK